MLGAAVPEALLTVADILKRSADWLRSRGIDTARLDAELLVGHALGLPRLRVYAVDLSEAALANTRANVEALGLGERVAVLKGDLLAPIPPHRPVDLVVSNPPYIASAVLDGLQPEVRDHEPKAALDGGPDGLQVYRRLLPMAAARARVGVAVEIGHDQGPAVMALFRAAGLQGLRCLPDLGHRDRVVLGTVPGAAWPVEPPAPAGQVHVEPIVEEAPALDEEGAPLPVFDADR